MWVGLEDMGMNNWVRRVGVDNEYLGVGVGGGMGLTLGR